MSAFERFSPRLREAIAGPLGFDALRPVQEEAAHALLDGRNAVILAPTAGGKTEAAIFPALSMVLEEGVVGLHTLYIAPIKALLNNQAARLERYTRLVGLERFVWHGDVPSAARKRFVRAPSAVLMTTPESLEVMCVSLSVPVARLFEGLKLVIVDEVHALAGTDRGAHLMSVLERLVLHSLQDVQRVGLSATVGNPEQIGEWLQGSSRRPRVVINPPQPPVRRQLLIAQREDQGAVSRDVAQLVRVGKSLVFCEARATAEAIAGALGGRVSQVFVHHSAVSASERARAEAMFHSGESACIVCTSTLELGIDVGDLDRVVQIDAPATVSAFMQRMGRTGRRPGQIANTTFLCETTDETLQAVALVELARAGWVESVPVQTRCWSVCVHQLLAMALETGGVTFERAWRHLSRVPDLAGLRRGEVERLVAWMLHHEALVLVSGALVLGPEAERRFGRRHFTELFSVFTAPSSYTVQTGPDHTIGTLTQDFVDQLVAGESCFLLGGRAWALLHVQHVERRVVVEPASAGRRPTWGGRLPQFLSREVCEAMRAALTSSDALPYLDPHALTALREQRVLMAPVFEAGNLEQDLDTLSWWTFAGGRINATLRYAISSIEPAWSVIPDNLRLRLRGDGLDHVAFERCLAQLHHEEVWRDEVLWRRIAGGLPEYRISKFQPLMPPWVVQELLADFLLDVEGTWRWLSAQRSASFAPGEARVLTTSSLRPASRDVARALVWVDTQEGLEEAVTALCSEAIVGLDVETTLKNRALCLIQIAGAHTTYLIDALALDDLNPLTRLLSASGTLKLIHNASFERSVLGAHGLTIEPVLDTLARSRAMRGRSVEGGHSLKAVCARELGVELPKEEQTSDWTRRPLTEAQRSYAALDAEVLLEIYRTLGQS